MTHVLDLLKPFGINIGTHDAPKPRAKPKPPEQTAATIKRENETMKSENADLERKLAKTLAENVRLAGLVDAAEKRPAAKEPHAEERDVRTHSHSHSKHKK